MKIAIIGGGGREHALAWKLNQSDLCSGIFCIPGNGGTKSIATNVEIDILDFDSIIEFVKKENIELTIVGPEVPLVAGIVDAFEKEGLKIFGPNALAAQLEGSKQFSKDFMARHDIPTARFLSADSYEEAVEYLGMFSYPLVIKDDGLAAGKGVVIVEDEVEALNALSNLFSESLSNNVESAVVIEEYLVGYEVSQLCFVAGNKLYPMDTSQDYKRIGENDTGENTGGVGCLSPSPTVDATIFEDSYQKIEAGLKADNIDFYGILFIGYMIVDDIPYVLEFNTRFGDPETEVLMPRLQNDLVRVFLDVLDNKDPKLVWSNEKALAIVLTSAGYPGHYDVGFDIEMNDNGLVYHNGTVNDGSLKTNGGRVLTVVEMGEDFKDLNRKVVKRVDNISFEGKTFRRDIGL